MDETSIGRAMSRLRALGKLPAIALIIAVFASLIATPSFAAVNRVDMVIASDGTPGWDSSSGTGFDTGPRIRTH